MVVGRRRLRTFGLPPLDGGEQGAILGSEVVPWKEPFGPGLPFFAYSGACRTAFRAWSNTLFGGSYQGWTVPGCESP
jgi:hypothetical protein